MADIANTAKEQKLKLAHSRKKFKELQELKKKRTASEQPPLVTNVDPLPATSTSLSHTSLDDNGPDNQKNVSEVNNQLPNYFNKNSNYASLQENVMFFDNFSSEVTETFNSEQVSGAFNYLNSSSPQTTYLQNMISNVIETQKTEKPFESNYTLFSQENQPSFLAETQQIIHPHQDSITEDDPEITQNEISELQMGNNADIQNRQNLIDYFSDSNETGEGDQVVINNDSSSFNNMPETHTNQSSVESLKQLSSQMAQAIEPEYAQYSNSITDLEKRNLELAALLEQQKLKAEQQKLFINELQSKIAQLESERKLQDEQSNLQLSNTISKLKEELQFHIQTVGLLVAEKTELSANLSQTELSCKQKNSECEELQARLKASRSRVADLEREVNMFKNEKLMNDNIEKQQSELSLKLKRECDELKEQKEELVQDLLEVREKLKNSLEENLRFQQKLEETTSKLLLAEVKIQQITNGEQSAVLGQLEPLAQEKFELEKQISNLNLMLKTISKERDESSVQYQQYAQQLNAQITNLSNRIEQLQQENERLSMQEQNRIKHISELERQLQNLQNQQVAFATSRSFGDGNIKTELENTQELCIQLQMEKTAAEENLTKTINEKEMLLKELAAKNDSLSQLETIIEQLRGNQPDSVKLLATMESDKVAAARAVQQNKELKEQMESMQEVFMKLDNDKVDLTEKLSLEQGCNRELLEKLQKVELHVQRLTDAIEIKDRELSSLRESTEDLRKQVLHHEQLADRLGHFEAQDNSSHILQFELQEAKKTIVNLTTEINMLKNEINSRKIKEVTESSEVVHTEPVSENGSENLNPQEALIDESKDNSISPSIKETLEDNKVVNESSSLDKELAMKVLEEKFKKTMDEIASLTDEKQRLEHLVLQLQGETETIGEYVALYQHQRMVLKQKAIEKDQQLKQLASDREQMKIKLEKLNELIKKLVIEKGQVPPELLQEHKSVTEHSDRFCEEHSKLHEEINKINDSIASQNLTGETSETAKEIIDLLSEIKSSNLIQNDEEFHHCPWCSGKLITV